jgi:hypothetical protein
LDWKVFVRTADYFAVNTHVFSANPFSILSALTFRRTDFRRNFAPPTPLETSGFIAVLTFQRLGPSRQPMIKP